MIVLQEAAKHVTFHGRKQTVLAPVNLQIPTNRRIALLTSSEDEKKVFIELLAGLALPSSGRIVRAAKVSFPVGYLGGFDTQTSVRLNVAHVARLYGADVPAVVAFVERVAELGDAFDKRFGELSPPARRLVGCIATYGIPFDVYLLMSEPARGRKDVRQISQALFASRARTAGMIIPTQDVRFARKHCDMAMVLHSGRLLLHDDVQEAFAGLESPRKRARLKRARR